jgi:SAM-dependent methyltransferase
MGKNRSVTKWNHDFDDRPTSDIPRIRFSEKFSVPYLEDKHLILEIGCGTGSYTRLINRTGYVAMDLDIEAIKVAKNYCRNADFAVASAFNLPFRDQIFDLICIWGVFEEVPINTEKLILLEVHRTLATDAILLLSTYNDHVISKLLDPAFIFRGVRHYDSKKFTSLLSEYGFIVREHTIRGGLNTVIDIFLFYFNKHVLKRRDTNIKNFFEKKSAKEFGSPKSGIVYLYVAANKN